eukprot:TRINITY_DN4809_c0_g1_i1.p1 TRINITY_DN4809_c0_g1~~TRINITY_DN4809_c0_g1_i1.p1  ORF type:complete len:425 (+),score=91.57 TRINITY_DN4809_c0_g1_i1:111-1385(+)
MKSAIKSITCALVIIILSSSWPAEAQQVCTQDWQCGTIPFGLCSGSTNDCPTTILGVAVDSATNRVYYGAECRDISGNISNVTIKSVSASGGTATNVYTEPIARAGGNIVKVFQVVNNVLYFDRVERQPGSQLSSFNLASRQETPVTLTPGFFQTQLEIAGTVASYTCQLNFSTTNTYTIVRFNGVVGQTAATTGTTLYTIGSNQCGPIRRGNGTDLFFTVYTITPDPVNIANYTTTFYRGTVTGGSTLPTPFFSVNAEVTDFDVDSTGSIIIYGTANGLYRRVGTTITQLNNERITGVTIYNDVIYYNNGATIRTTSLIGQNTANLVQSSTNGTCVCRPRFTGSNCQTCNGQVQWNQGIPSCIPTNAAGVPTSCVYDYQCGNVPFTFCAVNVCSCRGNFTGDRCDQCASPRTTTWRNGIPYCG